MSRTGAPQLDPPECCAEAGFATKPELGLAMLNRAYQAGVLSDSSTSGTPR
jgi:hypothetical protein